jgi:glycosyltransferase involved in cell wall biosynthesis
VVTQYSSATTILHAKLAALDGYEDLDVCVVSGPPPEDRVLGPDAVRHLVVPMVRPIRVMQDLRCARAMRDLFRDEGIDVVHTHTAKAGILGAIAGRWAGVRLVVHTCHGLTFYEGQPRLRYHFYRGLEKAACGFRHYLLSQNKRDMAACERLMGGKGRVYFEGNGVDVGRVVARAAEGAAEADGDYPPGGVRVAIVSRFDPVKRVGDFVRVCAGLVESGVEVSAVICGHGVMEGALRAEIDDRGLSDRVRILGWRPDVLAVVGQADVVMLVSEKEGIPRSLMEAMALSKPVVATNVLGTQELVVDGETGFLARLGDVGGMVSRVRQLAMDDGLRAQFGRAGRRRIEAHFNDVKIAGFLRDFYVARFPARD